jgi:hypothetical protein
MSPNFQSLDPGPAQPSSGVIIALPCRAICRAGLRWCDGWRRANLRGSHDQSQIQAEGCDPLSSSKDQQAQISRAIGARIIQAGNGRPHQTRPHHRNAAIAGGRNDRCDHDCHGLAATFGAQLSCRCRPQETRAQPCFRANGQVKVRFYSSMLIRGIGKNSKSQVWLGTAGHHRESRWRQRSLIYGASNWSLTLVDVICIYGTQCMVGLLAGIPSSICLRARLQDRTTVCMACSAFFVISRICRSVVSISLRGAALVSSFATSCTAANMARILPRSSRARWARSGRSISSCRPKLRASARDVERDQFCARSEAPGLSTAKIDPISTFAGATVQ